MTKTIDLKEMLRLAQDTAIEAGKLLLEGQKSGFSVSKKGRTNLVTEMDLRVEQRIVERILTQYPDHRILAEEQGGARGSSPVLWIIDPIDGTTNYAHGYPAYSVSIGAQLEGDLVLGVVYAPVFGECFTAIRGQGAFLNDTPIQVSNRTEVEESLLATGFSYEIEAIRRNLVFFGRAAIRARGIIRDGSAAIDLCLVACGRLDAYWELTLFPWDVAAGAVILKEAGGKLSRPDGSPWDLYGNEFLASNGAIHDDMLGLLKG